MNNTKVTIEYSNGDTREFVASDNLEKMINDGEMFSVTTMHSDMSIDEEVALSKMHAGNPMAALGHMLMMRKNAENLLKEDESMNVVIETLTAAITFLSNELTSHQSGMVVPEQLDDDTIRHGNEIVQMVPETDSDYTCDGCMYSGSNYPCTGRIAPELLVQCAENEIIFQPIEKH